MEFASSIFFANRKHSVPLVFPTDATLATPAAKLPICSRLIDVIKSYTDKRSAARTDESSANHIRSLAPLQNYNGDSPKLTKSEIDGFVLIILENLCNKSDRETNMNRKKRETNMNRKKDASNFQSHLPTVQVAYHQLAINDDLIAKVSEAVVEAFGNGPLVKFNKKVQRVLSKISELEKKTPWIEMQEGICYFSKLNAFIPMAKDLLISRKCVEYREPYEIREIAYKYFIQHNLLLDKKAHLPSDEELLLILQYKPNNYLRTWESEQERLSRENKGIKDFFWLTEDRSVPVKNNYDCRRLVDDSSCAEFTKPRGKGVNDCFINYSCSAPRHYFTFICPIVQIDDLPKGPADHSFYLLKEWLNVGVTPKKMAEDTEFCEVVEFLKNHKNIFSGNNESGFLAKDKVLALFQKDTLLCDWKLSQIVSDVFAGENQTFAKHISSVAATNLLECDLLRSDIHPVYTDKILTNINMGHWDLWGDNATIPKNVEKVVAVPCEFIARNPRFDIKEGGRVGIDFGTKSTTVVRAIPQEKMPKPMRIGNGDYDKLPDSFKDYENPTTIQFIDWRSFVEDYTAKAGRPNTRWADLIISHTALNRLKESEESALFQTFHSDLKQWAGSRRIFRLADLQGHKWELHPFAELSDDEIDPIEIYAYNIGLFINNMNTGIFLQYELSYPITYDKDIRDRLRTSFERGIKKTLPLSIQNDKEAMQKFYVRFAASEPAAYSLCALQEFGFAPQAGEQCFYGVFDFGGGTSDFDFGVFREANDDESDEEYDYVLEHFLPSGDKYLGGENILQLLSYEVFKNNKAKLLKEGITFPRPYEADNTAFAGEEGLLSDAPEARLNMQLMMEKLRPVWETAPGTELSEEFSSGLLKMKLFDKFGEQKTNVELKVDTDSLREIIKKRIERGVVNFFARLHESFKTSFVPENTDKINIFLAGNSCKSHYVKELFEEYIKSYDKKAKDFDLYAPLGSPEAIERMQTNHIEMPTDAQELLLMPTGKTGVAFGLIMGSGASNIKIIDKNIDASGKIAFRFYVGKQSKGIFKPILTIHSEIQGKWERIQSVGTRPVVEIHSSELAEAGTGELPISKTASITIPIQHPDQTNMGLFIRVHSANEIEYALENSAEKIKDSNIVIQRLEET